MILISNRVEVFFIQNRPKTLMENEQIEYVSHLQSLKELHIYGQGI